MKKAQPLVFAFLCLIFVGLLFQINLQSSSAQAPTGTCSTTFAIDVMVAIFVPWSTSGITQADCPAWCSSIYLANGCWWDGPSCSANYGQSCPSSANACGVTSSGSYSCGGTCSATAPANPSGYGSQCTVSSACGTASGTWTCGGGSNSLYCSATAPAVPSNYGQPCNKNACGQYGGTITCSGACSGPKPSSASCEPPAPQPPTPPTPSGCGPGTKNDTCTCANGASNYPTCTPPPLGCSVAPWLPWCSQPPAPQPPTPPTPSGCGPGTLNNTCTCANGASNYPTCTPPNPPGPPAPTATFSATPSTIDAGQSSTLTWSSSNANSCTAAGGFSTGGERNGSVSTGALTATSNYQLTCSGPGGSTNASVTVTVNQPQASLSVVPNRVYSGNNSTITWSASQVTSCSVSGPGVSATGFSGTRTVAITQQSTYTLTCQTLGSPLVKTATVNVNPGFQEF